MTEPAEAEQPDPAPRRKQQGARRARTAAETAWCLQERIKGKSLQAIADATTDGLGYPLSLATVWRRIETAIEERVNPRVDQLRQLEEARYDSWLEALSGKIAEGDEKAIAQATRIAERRAKLLGLDAPVKIGIDATVRYVIEGVDTAALT